MFDNIQFNSNSEIDLSLIVLNLFCAFIISLLIKFHYKKCSTTLTNREDFSNLFPFITLTIVLVIYIVKSSLALSLGLVGALSIVRFRTPIKEPEELAYLFICIAAGLGYGANQTIPTTVAVLLILLLVYLLKIKKVRTNNKNIFLNLEIEKKDNINTSEITKNINHSLFIETCCKQPSLHLVFKSEKYLNDFKEPNAKSSSKSAFLKIQKKVPTLSDDPT